MWLREFKLRYHFRRLFDLSDNPWLTVLDMFSLGWGVEGETWTWRRRLLAWEEEMVEECRVLLDNVHLYVTIVDQWCWQLDPVDGYSVRGAYQLLIGREPSHFIVVLDLIWNKDVPLKVSLYAWRLLRIRLSTKDLFRRYIIPHNTKFCASGCNHIETANHMFLSCNIFSHLWVLVHNLLGLSLVDPFVISDHFIQFGNSAGISKKQWALMHLIWFVGVWVIWNERNNMIFTNKEHAITHLLNKVELFSFWWFAKFHNFVLGYYSWWLYPFACLGIG